MRLAIMGRPRGGEWLEDEINSLRIAGIDVVVSLLTADEIPELDLADESAVCSRHGLHFRSFPITDRGIPQSECRFREFINDVVADLAAGRSVAIHCRAGIGRSSLVAASLLAIKGYSVDKAFDTIIAARGCSVPDTPEQRAWVTGFVERF